LTNLLLQVKYQASSTHETEIIAAASSTRKEKAAIQLWYLKGSSNTTQVSRYSIYYEFFSDPLLSHHQTAPPSGLKSDLSTGGSGSPLASSRIACYSLYSHTLSLSRAMKGEKTSRAGPALSYGVIPLSRHLNLPPFLLSTPPCIHKRRPSYLLH
jgi:hypothetical protein